jgi:hypothetical protein
MQLPRVRFTVRWMMVGVAVVALVLVVEPEAAWDGHATIPLDFRVLDASTERPIEGASIRLDEGSPEYKATTGPDGCAKVIIRTMTGGRSSLLRNTRTVDYGWRLVISADGYGGLIDDLRRFTREPRYHSAPAPPPVVIRLAPVPSWK